MRRLVIVILFIFSFHFSQATVFRISVTFTDQKAGFGYGGSGTNAEGMIEFIDFSCLGQCNKIAKWKLNAKAGDKSSPIMEFVNSNNPASKYSKMNEFISETGQVFSITDLILKYEKMILSQKKSEWEIVGQESTDVTYSLAKKDNYYIIMVFTAKHAKQTASNFKLEDE